MASPQQDPFAALGARPVDAQLAALGARPVGGGENTPRQPGDSYAINPYDPHKPVDPPPNPGHDIARAVMGALSEANPVDMVKGLWDMLHVPTFAANLGLAHWAQLNKAVEAANQGRTSEAFGHALAAALPLIGPHAADIGETIGAGDVAGGLGHAAGLVGTFAAPGLVRGAAKLASKAPGAEAVAGIAERQAGRTLEPVIAPMTGPNKTSLGKLAAKVAPKLAADPDLSALSRTSLGAKVANQLEAAGAKLDEAAAARNPNELIDTSMVVSGLKDRLAALTAQSAEGAQAHATVKAMGLGGLPDRAPVTRPFAALPVEYQAELRRINTELEDFPYIRQDQEVSSRAAAADPSLDYQEKSFKPGTAGSPVLHDIGGAQGRSEMAATLRGFIESGQRLPTAVVKRIIEVADARLRGGPSPQLGRPLGRAMLPIEDFQNTSGPLGEPVLPEPNQAHAAPIQKAIEEVQKLGPAATYDALLKIRKSYDGVAAAAKTYLPSVTPNFKQVSTEAKGAADVAGVFRDVLAQADPKTATINKEYSFYKSAHDVIQAAEDADRVRPKVGRQIMSRLTGAVAGGEAAGGFGSVVGIILAPTLERGFAALTEGRKIVMARYLADIAKALRSGEAPAIESALRKFRAVSLITQAAAKGGGSQ